LVFLEGNGITVPEATDELHAAMIALAERRLDKAELAALLRGLSNER
jgi:prophage maintenance system killer protein